MEQVDYGAVTERRGMPATREQLDRIYQRYGLARELATDRRILEVACGVGLGLEYVSRAASRTVGGDYMHDFLLEARASVPRSVSLIRYCAEDLPFCASSFDIVACFEAIYYFETPARFVAEARRVLADGGELLIGFVNPEWSGFVRSPFTRNCLMLSEIVALLRSSGFRIRAAYGGYSAESRGLRTGVVSGLRFLASRLGFVPGSLQARAKLKRLFYGPTLALPRALPADDPPDTTPLTPLDPATESPPFKILYVVAARPEETATGSAD